MALVFLGASRMLWGDDIHTPYIHILSLLPLWLVHISSICPMGNIPHSFHNYNVANIREWDTFPPLFRSTFDHEFLRPSQFCHFMSPWLDEWCVH